MNKQIEELIEQAYVEVLHERDWDATSQVFDKEKFAKLIILECRMTVGENFHECRTATKMDQILRDHFGLEK